MFLQSAVKSDSICGAKGFYGVSVVANKTKQNAEQMFNNRGSVWCLQNRE